MIEPSILKDAPIHKNHFCSSVNYWIVGNIDCANYNVFLKNLCKLKLTWSLFILEPFQLANFEIKFLFFNFTENFPKLLHIIFSLNLWDNISLDFLLRQLFSGDLLWRTFQVICSRRCLLKMLSGKPLQNMCSEKTTIFMKFLYTCVWKTYLGFFFSN